MMETAPFDFDLLLCCCPLYKRNHGYEDINENAPIESLENHTVPHINNGSDYVVEFDGFYYKRNTVAGSKHYLLGSSPTFSVSSNESDLFDFKDSISVDISSARSVEDTRAFWLRIDDFHCINPKMSSFKDIDQLKFKIKIYRLVNIKASVKKNLVAKLESQFMQVEDAKKHVFKLYAANGQLDSDKNFKDLMVQLKVRAKCGNQKSVLKLGHVTMLLEDLDDRNGNIFVQKKTLTNDGINRIGAFLFEKPIL